MEGEINITIEYSHSIELTGSNKLDNNKSLSG